VAQRSRHDWTIFTGRYARDDTFPGFLDLPVVEMDRLSVKRNAATVALACARLLISRPKWRDFDALVISCEGIGNLMTIHAGGLPTFCLCHTPLKVAYDPWTRERWLSEGKPSRATLAAVALYKRLERPLWRRYRRVFCVSGEVERRVLYAGLVPPGRTAVVHPGVDTDRLAPSGRREPIFLMPGRIMWSKNVELGIRAFVEMKSRMPAGAPDAAHRLVIAGMVDQKSVPYLRDLQHLAAGRDDIEFVISPTDEVLFDLYDRCTGVLFTPLNEDWGIVPLEAMAYGKPVIAVGRGGPSESIVHKETGLLCAPEPSSFAAAMNTLLSDAALREEMSRGARARAERYHWRSFVSDLDNQIEALAGVRASATAIHEAPDAIR
jgi:glycosyltransferase involved in cell wall biosynthesis